MEKISAYFNFCGSFKFFLFTEIFNLFMEKLDAKFCLNERRTGCYWRKLEVCCYYAEKWTTWEKCQIWTFVYSQLGSVEVRYYLLAKPKTSISPHFCTEFLTYTSRGWNISWTWGRRHQVWHIDPEHTPQPNSFGGGPRAKIHWITSRCHRMVVVSKPSGEPRHTVDLSSFNKCCQRETHVTMTPYR